MATSLKTDEQGVLYEGAAKTKLAAIARLLTELTDEQRLEAYKGYCKGCGTDITVKRCHCQNDE